MASGLVALNMLILNEERLLRNLLPYVKPWVDQMVFIIDNRSEDLSHMICAAHSPYVYRVDLNMDFGHARNIGVQHSEMPWVFQIDADEWPNEYLLRWMREYLPRAPLDEHGVLTLHENLIDGKPIGERTHEWHLRLFRRQHYYVKKLHEYPSVPFWRCGFAPKDAMILHHKTSERQQMQNQRYREWEA